MASIKAEQNPFSKSPLINITNVTIPLQKEKPNAEIPQRKTEPEANTDSPAVLITLSDKAQTALAESNATNIPEQVIEPNIQAIDGEPIDVNISVNESTKDTVNTDVAGNDIDTSSLEQLRTDIASVFDSIRLSRPERTVLNRALENTNLSSPLSSEADDKLDHSSLPGLTNGNGKAIGIEQRLINLLQGNLNLPNNTAADFDSLTSFFDSLIASIQENTLLNGDTNNDHQETIQR